MIIFEIVDFTLLPFFSSRVAPGAGNHSFQKYSKISLKFGCISYSHMQKGKKAVKVIVTVVVKLKS